MNIIGFATKFYTLWEKNEFTKPEIGKFTEYRFIKIVSTDLNKVKDMYPDVEIDMGLCGSRTFVVYDKKDFIKEPNDCFQFGKYKGQKIIENTDYEYMVWYYQHVYCESEDVLANVEYIKNVLEPLGYSFVGHWCYNPETTKYLAERKMKIAEAKERVKNGNVDFIAEKNLDNEGHITINEIDYEFENYKVLSYAGYEYGLPTINEKGKKIKGKKIVITDFEVIGETSIKIKKFKVESI